MSDAALILGDPVIRTNYRTAAIATPLPTPMIVPCPKRIGNPSEAEETPNSIDCGAAVALVDGHLWERATAVAFGKCAHGCSVRRQLGPVTLHDSFRLGPLRLRGPGIPNISLQISTVGIICSNGGSGGACGTDRRKVPSGAGPGHRSLHRQHDSE